MGRERLGRAREPRGGRLDLGALSLAALAMSFAAAQPARADDWPWWRGPTGDGVCHEKGLPEVWSASENVVWQADLPGPGNSSPIVAAGKVFVTAASDEGKTRSLLCFDRLKGTLLWRQDIRYEAPETTHDTNPHCAATPACDGSRVYVSYGSAGVYAYDLEGKELWKRDLGPMTHIWGSSCSPTLHKDTVLMLTGPGLKVSLIALNRADGSIAWEKPLPQAQANAPGQFKGAWCTPVKRNNHGRSELILALPGRLLAVNPDNGEDIWWAKGMTDLAYVDPLVSGDIVVGMSGYMGAAFAVEAGKDCAGDVTDKTLWTHPKNPQRIGSGVVREGHVYILNENGVAWCVEARTGKIVWQEPLGDKRGQSWNGAVLVGDKVYCSNMRGQTFILDAKPVFNLRQTNSVNSLTRSTPAFSDGCVYIKTYQKLYCVAGKPRV